MGPKWQFPVLAQNFQLASLAIIGKQLFLGARHSCGPMACKTGYFHEMPKMGGGGGNKITPPEIGHKNLYSQVGGL